MRYIADVEPKKKTKKYGGSTSGDKLEGSTNAEQQANKTSINKGNSLIGNISLTKGNAYGLSFKIVAVSTSYSCVRGSSYSCDYWLGAKQYCEGMEASLSSKAQLTEIADKIYLVDGANCTKDTANGQPRYSNCNQSVIEAQPLKQYLGAEVWSNSYLGISQGSARTFDPSSSGSYYYRRNNHLMAVCVR
jgi:hypothetical protein